MVRIDWDESENSNAEVVHSVGAVDKATLTDTPQYLEVRPDAGGDVPSPDRWDEYDMERASASVSEGADAVYREDTPVRALRARYYENGGTNGNDLYTLGLEETTPGRSAEHLARRYGGNLPRRRGAALVALVVFGALVALVVGGLYRAAGRD